MPDTFKPLSPDHIAQAVDQLALYSLASDRIHDLYARISPLRPEQGRCNWPVCDQCEAGQE